MLMAHKEYKRNYNLQIMKPTQRLMLITKVRV